MSMSVSQMLRLSKIFLFVMLLLLILAIIIYFVFDIKRAFRMLINKNISLKHTKIKNFDKEINRKTGEIKKKQKQLQKQSIPNTTTVLKDTQTMILPDILKGQDSMNKLLLDITFTHTEIII